MNKPSKTDVIDFALGFSTPFVLFGIYFAWEWFEPQRRWVWSKRPFLSRGRFRAIHLTKNKTWVWCKRCDWSASGTESETIAAMRHHFFSVDHSQRSEARA